MNVAALLQDSPSDERRRNNNSTGSGTGSGSAAGTGIGAGTGSGSAVSSGNGNGGGVGTGTGTGTGTSTTTNPNMGAGNNNMATGNNNNNDQSHATWPSTNSPSNASVNWKSQQQQQQHSSNPSSSSSSPVLSRISHHTRTHSQPGPSTSNSAPASTPPVWPTASSGSVRIAGPEARGETGSRADAVFAPRRDLDEQQQQQPRIHNIMDWTGERDRPVKKQESKSHSASPVAETTPLSKRRGSRPGSAPTEGLKIPPSTALPRSGEFPYHNHFQPFVTVGTPVPAPIPAPAPGTLSLVPPQHQQSHQQHQLAQAQAQQQQIHVNAQGPAVGVGTGGPVAVPGATEPRGGTIVNLNASGQVLPQKQFQNQFHTQFLPGLQLTPGAKEGEEVDTSHPPQRRASPVQQQRRPSGGFRGERERDYRDTGGYRIIGPGPSSGPDTHPQRDMYRHQHMMDQQQQRERMEREQRERLALDKLDRIDREREAYSRERERERILNMSMTMGDRERGERDLMRERERERTRAAVIGIGMGDVGAREREMDLDHVFEQRLGGMEMGGPHQNPSSLNNPHPLNPGPPDSHSHSHNSFDSSSSHPHTNTHSNPTHAPPPERGRERETETERARERELDRVQKTETEIDANRARDRDRDREREKERDRDRDRDHTRDQTRDQTRDRDKEGVRGLGDTGKDRQVKSRVKINLGTYVWPKTPFPYLFGAEREWTDDESGNVARKDKGDKENEQLAGEEQMPVDGEKPASSSLVWTPDMDPLAGLLNLHPNPLINIHLNSLLPPNSNPNPIPNSNSLVSSSSDPDADSDVLDSETLVTIIIPNGFIPLERPKQKRRYRVWGGGVLSSASSSMGGPSSLGLGERGSFSNSRGMGMDVDREGSGGQGCDGRDGREAREGRDGRDGRYNHPPHVRHISNSHVPVSSSINSTHPAANTHPLHNSNTNPNASAPQTTPQSTTPRRRRIYTDDSDIFLCALHSGWVTWSGAKKAREEGRDMCVRLRVIRCLGAGGGAGAGFAVNSASGGGEAGMMPWVENVGGGGEAVQGAENQTQDGQMQSTNGLWAQQAQAQASQHQQVGSEGSGRGRRGQGRGKEEVVARFMGGMGEQYFGGDRMRSGWGSAKKQRKGKESVGVEKNGDEQEKEQLKKETAAETISNGLNISTTNVTNVVPASAPKIEPSTSNSTSTEEGELKEEGELDQDLELPVAPPALPSAPSISSVGLSSAPPVGTSPAPPIGPSSSVPSVGPSSAPTAHGPSTVYPPLDSEPNLNLEPELELVELGERKTGGELKEKGEPRNNGDQRKRERDEQEPGQDREEAIPDNPDDDGRSLLSASWGIGHDGSAIEVLEVEFIERTPTHRSGLRNRSQRLLEYAEQRAKVFGISSSSTNANASQSKLNARFNSPLSSQINFKSNSRLGSRNDGTFITSQAGMKRSRGAFAFEGSFPVHAPTSTLSVNEEEEEEKRLFERRTVVFGSKIGVGKGTEPWYKYTPDALRNAVVSISGLDSDFILGSSSHSEREPPAKRIRTDDTATSTSASPTSTSPTSTKNHSHSAIVLEWDDKSDPRCGVLCILRTERKPETTASAALNPTSTAAAATTATKMESNTCTGTNEALLPETEQPDQIKLIGQATNHPYSCPYVLFITEQSRVKECLEYRFPESSTPKIKLSASDAAEGDVEMEVDTIDTAKLSSSSFLIPRASALSTSCLSKGADGWDWVIPSDSDSNSTSDCKPCCVYTKAEDVWILGLEAIRFVDGGMKVVGVGTNGMDETGGMRTVPVTRWKFVSNS